MSQFAPPSPPSYPQYPPPSTTSPVSPFASFPSASPLVSPPAFPSVPTPAFPPAPSAYAPALAPQNQGLTLQQQVAQGLFPYLNRVEVVGQVFPSSPQHPGFCWRPGQEGREGRLEITLKLRKAWGGYTPGVRQTKIKLIAYGPWGQALAGQLRPGLIVRAIGEIKISHFKIQQGPRAGQWSTSAQVHLRDGRNHGEVSFEILGGPLPIVEEGNNYSGGYGGGYGASVGAPVPGGAPAPAYGAPAPIYAALGGYAAAPATAPPPPALGAYAAAPAPGAYPATAYAPAPAPGGTFMPPPMPAAPGGGERGGGGPAPFFPASPF